MIVVAASLPPSCAVCAGRTVTELALVGVTGTADPIPVRCVHCTPTAPLRGPVAYLASTVTHPQETHP